MEQNELHNLEAQCVQETPPPCLTRCPLHLDVRATLAAVRRRDLPGAVKIIRKYLPFPAIICRICDQYCQTECRRRTLGGPLQIGALVQACLNLAPASPTSLPLLPSSGRQVAVIGSGLSGLTAAYDLAKKGYSITLFEQAGRPGGSLWDYPVEKLPVRIIRQDLAVLDSLKIHVELNNAVDSAGRLEAVLSEFVAVYIDPEAVAADQWGLEATTGGVLKIDPATLAAGRSGVFAGPREENSPVLRAAAGRRGAVSIDRFCQQASLTAARLHEEPYASSLYTSLEGVDFVPTQPPADPGAGYSLEEAVTEASRCLHCECLECVKSCVYLQNFGAYPRRYVRQIYNNESIVMGSHSANKLINSCMLCGLCAEICPQHLDMAAICLEARRRMVNRGRMPPSTFEFALQDLEFSRSPRFSLAAHAPGCGSSRYVFFPGCQLCASDPQAVMRVYDLLTTHLAADTGLILNCCGAPALWAGQSALFEKILEELRGLWQSLDRPRLILACSTCYRIFRDHLPDISVMSLWEVMEQLPLPRVNPPGTIPVLAVQDPCTSRHEPQIQAAVRRLLTRKGIQIEELDLSGSTTECCGFGGLVQNSHPDLAAAIIAKRASASPRDYLAYCAMCRDNLARTGKTVYHLLDLILPPDGNPPEATSPPPGWSARRENRAWLKTRLLQEKWQQETPVMEEYRRIKLDLTPPVKALLEKRRILIEDLQQVIAAAEKTGSYFISPQNGHLTASLKPSNVTFWVEYSRLDDGYRVHNAYCHRMEVAR